MTTNRMTTSQAARVLALSSERVRQLARSGRLPFLDTDLGRLFDADAVRTLAAVRLNTRDRGSGEINAPTEASSHPPPLTDPADDSADRYLL